MWESLLSHKKRNHTYYSCTGCQNEPCLKILIGLFPTKKIGCIKPKKPHPEHDEPNCSAENLTLAKKKELEGITNRILSEANQEIRKTFPGLDISDAANLVSEIHLEKKKNKIERSQGKH